MKLYIVKDRIDKKVRAIIEIDQDIYRPMYLSGKDRVIFERCIISDKISDKLTALQILARREEEHFAEKKT